MKRKDDGYQTMIIGVVILTIFMFFVLSAVLVARGINEKYDLENKQVAANLSGFQSLGDQFIENGNFHVSYELYLKSQQAYTQYIATNMSATYDTSIRGWRSTGDFPFKSPEGLNDYHADLLDYTMIVVSGKGNDDPEKITVYTKDSGTGNTSAARDVYVGGTKIIKKESLFGNKKDNRIIVYSRIKYPWIQQQGFSFWGSNKVYDVTKTAITQWDHDHMKE